MLFSVSGAFVVVDPLLLFLLLQGPSPSEHGADRPQGGKNAQWGQANASASTTPRSPASLSPAVAPRRHSQGIDVGEHTAGLRPRGGVRHVTGGRGADDGGGGVCEEGLGDSDEVTAADTGHILSPVEERVLDAMPRVSALSRSDATDDDNQGRGRGGGTRAGGAEGQRAEGQRAVNVDAEDSGVGARNGAGLFFGRLLSLFSLV